MESDCGEYRQQVGSRRHYVEVGFGRYASLGGEELRRVLGIVAAGLSAQQATSAGRVFEVPGLQAAAGQRSHILC